MKFCWGFEGIVEKHLKLGIEFDDLHRLFHTVSKSPELRTWCFSSAG
jgi:hypothetical protein